MQEKAQERPLVTFALFSYNQEKYIGKAIQGAFAQIYQPLEIILSDDCSTDRTFEIMQKMALNYKGPHKVRVRKTKKNDGTLNHVLGAARASRGELFILAAGDDISYPNRTCELVDRWQSTKALGLYSRYDSIDEKGQLLVANSLTQGGGEIRRWLNLDSNYHIPLGATSAYDRSVFIGLPFANSQIFSEDTALSFITMLKQGKLSGVESPLVGYRQHDNAWSNHRLYRDDKHSMLAVEARHSQEAKNYIALCNYLVSLPCFDGFDVKLNSEVTSQILATRRFFEVRLDMTSKSLLSRICTLFRCREWREIKYALPRIFGLRLLIVAKLVRRYIGRRAASFLSGIPRRS